MNMDYEWQPLPSNKLEYHSNFHDKLDTLMTYFSLFHFIMSLGETQWHNTTLADNAYYLTF